MIETTHVWEISPYDLNVDVRRTLSKKYGSKRSGTIYIIASCMAEAKEVAYEMFKMAGFQPPKNILIEPTHLVKNALRLIP